MKSLIVWFIFLFVSSCQILHKEQIIECGVGLKNEGDIIACATEVMTGEKVFSYGGVVPGRAKTTIDGYFVSKDIKYPPVIIRYGLGYDVNNLKTYSIDWVKPPQDVLTGPYPPKLMITIYPGIKGKEPRMEWKRLDQITL